MPGHPCKVQILLELWVDLPDDDLEADEESDRIGDDIVSTLETNIPDGIMQGSIAVVDWTDITPEENDA